MRTLAVLCSDIHLCHTCPPARSAEPDWYEAMKRLLDQLEDVKSSYGAPILCSGDVFDRWNSPPELINFAIENLPVVYAIPGQHDLPYHELSSIRKSAYWTLVEAGKICDVRSSSFGQPSSSSSSSSFSSLIVGKKLAVDGYPWGTEIKVGRSTTSCDGSSSANKLLHVALVHKYVWTMGKGYPGAPEEGKTINFSMPGYDVAVFGDNHQSFYTRCDGGSVVVNPGCLIPRKSDERGIGSSVYLLKEDKSIERVRLDTSEDKWIETDDVKTTEAELSGMQDFLDEIRSLDSDSLDFEAAVRKYCTDNKVSKQTERLVLESMGVE